MIAIIMTRVNLVLLTFPWKVYCISYLFHVFWFYIIWKENGNHNTCYVKKLVYDKLGTNENMVQADLLPWRFMKESQE